MSYDLIIKTTPGSLLSSAEKGHILAAFRSETNLDGPCEVTDLGMPPDDLDLDTLEEGIENGEFIRHEFEKFCSNNNIDTNSDQQKMYEAARLFLDTKQGQDIFVLNLPIHKKEVRKAYQLIVEFAKKYNLVLDDPQVGESIDLSNPGNVPPMWR